MLSKEWRESDETLSLKKRVREGIENLRGAIESGQWVNMENNQATINQLLTIVTTLQVLKSELAWLEGHTDAEEDVNA